MPEHYFQGGWTSPSPTSYAREHFRTSEKLSGGPRGLTIPAFLPFFDDQTGEVSVMRLYYRRMLADPVVKAALLGKILGVIALDLQIHPPDKDSEIDKEIAEFCRWNLVERLVGGMPGLGWNILIGMLVDGVCVVEPIWRVEEQSRKYKFNWVIAEAKGKDLNNDLVLDVDEFRNYVGVRGLRYNAGEIFDPRDFIISRNMPFLENPGGMSDLRAVYGRAWVLDTAWKLRAAGLERRSLPILWGSYLTDSQKPGLEGSLATARYSNWISTPEGVKVEALDIAGRSQDEFRNAIQDLREEIFLGIQGATLQALTGGQGAERGNSKVHENTANLLKWWLSEILCGVLNDHENGLLKKLVTLNYGEDVDIPRATLDAVDDLDLSQSLQVDMGLQQLGLKLSKSQLHTKYNRQPPIDEDDTLVSPQEEQMQQQQQQQEQAQAAQQQPQPGMDQGFGQEQQPQEGLEPQEVPDMADGFMDQTMFSGRMRRLFAEKLAERWNRRVPSKAAMGRAHRELGKRGYVVFHERGRWHAVERKKFTKAG